MVVGTREGRQKKGGGGGGEGEWQPPSYIGSRVQYRAVLCTLSNSGIVQDIKIGNNKWKQHKCFAHFVAMAPFILFVNFSHFEFVRILISPLSSILLLSSSSNRRKTTKSEKGKKYQPWKEVEEGFC